jgi:hypothetical protein
MAYSSIVKPTDYFNTVLYTGNGTDNHAITGVGFQPDFIWIKARSSAKEHRLQNAVSGITNHVRSNATNAESAGSVKTADSDGFTLGTGASWNENSTTYASWNWLAANGTASNTDGSITSTVSASTTAGFSIMSYTGTGANATIGHGLGAAPAMIIIKNLGATQGWCIFHEDIGATKFLSLNSTDAQVTASDRFNDTSPTSSVFSVGTHADTNGNSATYIAYCFAEKKGYSKIGNFTGNGSASDGTFVYLGFRPAWVMIKRTSDTGGWEMYDSKRDGFNPKVHGVTANTSNAEDNTDDLLDLLSNGFKLYHDGSGLNANGSTYIYMAFAENPFVANDSGTAVPVVAR